MTGLRRWVVITLFVVGVICLIIWARGTDHHRGQDVGALRASYDASSSDGA